MAEPFKNLVGAAAIARLGERVAAAWPAFDRPAFEAAAVEGLDALELKGRVAHVADALRAHLPAAWPAAAAVLAGVPVDAPAGGPETLSGAWLWPVLTTVEVHGAHDPATSLPLLRQLTRHFSAEFAIRPLLVAHPGPAWAALAAWVDDPDPRVRRLVSEGTRPRLPWGLRLRAAVEDPTPGLALLDRLVDDPSPDVRRSVANHLGDVAKDHPDRAVEIARRWLADDPARQPLVKHALRDLLKKGHGGALALFGAGGAEVEVDGLAVRPERAAVGGSVEIVANVVARTPGAVRVDVVWSWPGARGGWSSKTFRGKDRPLAAGEVWTFRHRLSLRPVSTRPLRPGPQRVTLRVQGRDVAEVGFLLAPDEGA